MFEVPEWLRDQERTMLGKNVVDEELKRDCRAVTRCLCVPKTSSVLIR